MGFKKSNAHITFADIALKDSMDKNRCLTRLMDITDTIDRDKIDFLYRGAIFWYQSSA